MKLINIPEMAEHDKAEVCRRVVEYLGVGYAPTHIIFDSNDYSGEIALLPEFRDVAFSWTKRMPMDAVPSGLAEIMKEPACTHLVWLSGTALAYSSQLFAFVVAHELRHVYQSRNSFNRNGIRNTVISLRRESRFSALPGSVMDAAEIDSDLCGLRVAEALYGALSATVISRCPYPSYVGLLREVSVRCNV